MSELEGFEKFEEWAEYEGLSLAHYRVYTNTHTKIAEEAWKAANTRACSELAEKQKEWEVVMESLCDRIQLLEAVIRSSKREHTAACDANMSTEAACDCGAEEWNEKINGVLYRAGE